MNIEAVIVDGKIYDIVKSESDNPCRECAFSKDQYCDFVCSRICTIDEHLKRRETK